MKRFAKFLWLWILRPTAEFVSILVLFIPLLVVAVVVTVALHALVVWEQSK